MSLTGAARLAGVMGWPVSHSRSPALHGHWLRRYRIDGAYLPLPVDPARLEPALRALPVLGFQGCNLTLPHKELAVALVDAVDPLARRIGAVNTIAVRPDGTLAGSNSDAFGFVASLDEGASGWRVATRTAVVLGAGGASRAVIVGLRDAGVGTVRLVNRNRERAQALAETLADPAIRVGAWEDRADLLADADLLVNATSLGMQGQPPLDLDLGALPQGAVVTDIVYTPLVTGLLAAARARGHRTVDGLGMLLHQARPGFRAWFGVEPTVDAALRAAVLAA